MTDLRFLAACAALLGLGAGLLWAGGIIGRALDEAHDILAALTVPLNEEGGRVFGTGRDTITVGQAVGGLGLAARRSEVVLALAHPDETEAMRKWASDGGPKPGLRKDGE